MRKMMMILALAAASLSTASSAQFVDYGSVGGWKIYSDTHDCTMSGDYERSGMFALDYNARTGRVMVRFAVPHTKSLKDKDVREIETVFTNGTAETVDLGWGTKPFIGTIFDNEAYLGREFDDEFLTDIARYKTVAFFYKGTVVTSYDLADTGKAVEMLKACAKSRSRANPSDPFINDKTV